jgi:Holliday junction resolvase-like predicted endonuclease
MLLISLIRYYVEHTGPRSAMLQKLPLTLSEFRILREQHYLYVDKTEYAYKMITDASRRFFLARPRRFGKSMLVSTLKEIFEGNKELFEGLWIAQSDYRWQKHGIITIDMSILGIHNAASLRTGLKAALQRVGDDYKILLDMSPEEPEIIFYNLIRALHERFGHVAILIDEYDSPLLLTLNDVELATAIRDGIRRFFAVIKGLDKYVDFAFITGISSFIKAGLFSGINNLEIITLDEQYASACGYTDEEVNHYFSEYITAWAEKNECSYEEIRTKIKEWYNGYHFGNNTPSVYNPYSLMHALKAQKYDDFWFSSGLPTFLANFLKKTYHTFDSEHMDINRRVLHGLFDVDMIPLLAIMFQAGYLTVASYDDEDEVYTLAFPNRETEKAVQTYLLEAFAHLDFVAVERLSTQLRKSLQNCTINDMVELFRQLFAHVPYQLHMREEKFYHALLQMAFTAVGIKAQSEYSTSDGRIDLVLELPNFIYIIEVKFGKKAEEALAQIEQKKYYERFLHQNKKIILLGLSFKREPSHFDITYAVKELSGKISS